MKRSRLLSLAGTAGVLFAAVALLAQSNAPQGAKIADAATKFLGTLTPEQKAKASFAFDHEHRQKWFFTPQQDKAKNFTRKGVRLEELTDAQRAAALELLKAGLSAKGFEQATTIISLESLLAELEGGKGAMVRNPGWYFVSVFGEPTNTGPWGWRFEGHHLSVNMTLNKGEIVTASPVLFGSNPAEVKDGARKGLRPLPEIEDRARELIKSLNPDQEKVAKQAAHLPEIKEGRPDANVGSPVGIPASKLTDAQKATLLKLLEAYASRLPADEAAQELDRAKKAGFDKVYFAYSGSAVVGQPYTYRVHGPTFVVEFLNIQADSAKNAANHIHSTWRRLPADFATAD